jgi:hypothetical protein
MSERSGGGVLGKVGSGLVLLAVVLWVIKDTAQAETVAMSFVTLIQRALVAFASVVTQVSK